MQIKCKGRVVEEDLEQITKIDKFWHELEMRERKLRSKCKKSSDKGL